MIVERVVVVVSESVGCERKGERGDDDEVFLPSCGWVCCWQCDSKERH